MVEHAPHGFTEAVKILPGLPLTPFEGVDLAAPTTLEDESVAQRSISFLGMDGTVDIVKIGASNVFDLLDDELLLAEFLLTSPNYKLVLTLNLKTAEDLLKIRRYEVLITDGSLTQSIRHDTDPWIRHQDPEDALIENKKVQVYWHYPENASEGIVEGRIKAVSITLAAKKPGDASKHQI